MKKISYWVNCTAVGDVCCAIPVIRMLIKENRLHKVLMNPKWVELFLLCDIPEEFIYPITVDRIKTYNAGDTEFLMANNPGKAAYRIHLIDLFSAFSVNAILKPEEKWVLANPDKLPNYELEKPFIVIGIGYAVPSRKMPLKCYLDIVKYCKKKGFNIVLLGAQRDKGKKPIIFDGYPTDDCIDLIGKTSFTESISIMNKAACVVGVDSGLIHLAALTEVPIVCGYTYVDPFYRAPFRYGDQTWKFYAVEPKSGCRYCSNGLAMFNVEFDTACPHGKAYECTNSLEGKDFISEIKKALKFTAKDP